MMHERNVEAAAAALRETAFLAIGSCQVNPIVLRIREDGPAILDEGVFTLQTTNGPAHTGPEKKA